MKDHVEKLESGGAICRHCGGAVDADGYAEGGEMEPVQDGDHDMDSEGEAMREGNTGEVPQQWQSAQRMRKRSLADALASRRGD